MKSGGRKCIDEFADHGCKRAEREFGRKVECKNCPRPICYEDSARIQGEKK